MWGMKKIIWATLEWNMWARKPGKIIGGAWETRGVPAGGATAKVLTRPSTPPRWRSASLQECVWWPAWLRGAQHGPQRVCLIQEGLISGCAGGGEGLPYWGNREQHSAASRLHNGLHCCVQAWPPLCATLFTKISFKQTKMPKLNAAAWIKKSFTEIKADFRKKVLNFKVASWDRQTSRSGW